MKIIVLHGQDTEKSYTRLTKFVDEAKKRSWEILYDEISTTPSLFGKERLIILKDIKLLNKKLVNILDRIPGTLVIYAQSDLSQTFLKSLPKQTKVEKYDLPKIIWNFLDTLSLKNLHILLDSEPIEFIFALICKRIRDLYWVKIDPKSIGYQSWQISKLTKQASKFSENQLANLMEELAIIDVKSKTGKGDLSFLLDLVFVKHLQ